MKIAIVKLASTLMINNLRVTSWDEHVWYRSIGARKNVANHNTEFAWMKTGSRVMLA